MARGRKTGGRDFVKGKPGGPGPKPLPAEILESRKLTREEIYSSMLMLLDMPFEELKQFVQDPQKKVHELIVARILFEAIKGGDERRVEWVLSRIFGKMTDKVDQNVQVNYHGKLMEYIMDRQRIVGQDDT